ncbi:transposase, partial [Pseudorhodobacter aquimaris]
IMALDHEIKGRAKTDEAPSRLMTIPGVGPMCATTIQAFAPPMEEFSNGREFAARVAGLYQGRSRPVGDKSWVEPQKWGSAI